MKLFILILCGLLIISIPCTIIAQDQYNVRLKAASTGKILRQQETKDLPGRYSNNGKYRCSFEIGHVTDEIRELGNLRFYENNDLIFTMDKAPGSDMYISNSGYIAFMDMKEHFRNRVGIHFYSRSGQYLFSETYEGAFQFGFSSTGNKFGVGTTKELNMISLPEKHVASFEKGYHFDISGDEVFTAVACENKINVYRYDSPVLDIRTGMPHKRDIKISTQNDIIAVIGKKNLKIYSLSDGDLRFEDRLNGPGSFRELEISGNELIAGINHKSRGLSKGSLRKYDLTGYGYINEAGLSKNIPTFDKQQDLTKKNTAYPSIPWPFIPFDELHTVWNYYEQHMGSTIPYLHQGLDLIVPMNEPTYAVEAGIVKCVLTLGGASYWRLATSETQVSGESEGWLYAHLVESSIAVDVGDTVDVHDYLGNIIRWSSDWGHIHFARIKDWGTVWRYNDDEWGIVYNPLLALDPNTDTIAPELKNVISGSKIVFYKNRLDTILDPDSLYGEIDIVIKVEDYIGDAEWTIPADITYYTIKRISDASVLVPRTIGHVLNHEYDFYASSNYYDYAPLIYKVNDDLQPSSWMDNNRNYYHILTNSNGDSLISLDESNLGFDTENYADGDYRLLVEACDAYGNSDIDSIDVKFRNGIISSVQNDNKSIPDEYILKQNYPNPFNSGTMIEFTLPAVSDVVLKVYDLLGREVKTIASGNYPKGTHRLSWNGTNELGSPVGSGVYICRIKAGNRTQFRKMVMIK